MNEIWIAIYIYDGVVSEVIPFGKKEDALKYFDKLVNTVIIINDAADFSRDEETGECYAFDDDGGRHPIEIIVNKKTIIE